MSKKEFLELLIKSFGLTPSGVQHYRTDGCGGQYETSIGWKGQGVNKKGVAIINFYEPDGFNMAVCEILEQANKSRLPIKFID